MPEELISLKITVIGDGDIGKTCMVRRFMSNKDRRDKDSKDSFQTAYVPTVFDYHERMMRCGSKTIKMCLWDTAGQVSYGRLLPLTLADTDFFIILFSIDNMESYMNVQNFWLLEINRLEKRPTIILVASKVDLRNDQETINKLAKEGKHLITTKQGLKLKEEINASGYFECSAKLNYKIDEIFEHIGKVTMNIYQRENRCRSCRNLFNRIFNKSS